MRNETEKAKRLVPEKDLEVLAAVRVFNADRLVAYDRHFDQLREHRTAKRRVEEFGVKPYPSQYQSLTQQPCRENMLIDPVA